jgi:hypothetical protein
MKSSIFNRRIMLLSITVILSVLLLIPNAWAKSSRYCANSQYVPDPENPIPSFWQSGPHVFHGRGNSGVGIVEGDIVAPYYEFNDNQNININTGKATAHGTQTIPVASYPALGLTGGFEGRTNGYLLLDGFALLGYGYDYRAFGSGEFEGMKLFQTCTYDPANGWEDCTGFILDPHGNFDDVPCEYE